MNHIIKLTEFNKNVISSFVVYNKMKMSKGEGYPHEINTVQFREFIKTAIKADIELGSNEKQDRVFVAGEDFVMIASIRREGTIKLLPELFGV